MAELNNQLNQEDLVKRELEQMNVQRDLAQDEADEQR